MCPAQTVATRTVIVTFSTSVNIAAEVAVFIARYKRLTQYEYYRQYTTSFNQQYDVIEFHQCSLMSNEVVRELLFVQQCPCSTGDTPNSIRFELSSLTLTAACFTIHRQMKIAICFNILNQ